MTRRLFWFKSIIIAMLLMVSQLSAASEAPTLEEQTGSVIRYLSSEQNYHFLLGVGKLEGEKHDFGYLAFERLGQFEPTKTQGADDFTITRFGMWGEGFNADYVNEAAIYTGTKFNFYLADNQIGPDHRWSGIGIGFGLIFSTPAISGLQFSLSTAIEPEIMRFSGDSRYDYQAYFQAELEYFIFKKFALTARSDLIFASRQSNFSTLNQGQWFGFRLFY